MPYNSEVCGHVSTVQPDGDHTIEFTQHDGASMPDTKIEFQIAGEGY